MDYEHTKLNGDILQYVSSYIYNIKSSNRLNNISIIVHKKKNKDIKNHKHDNNNNCSPQLQNAFQLPNLHPPIKRIRKISSTPEVINTSEITIGRKPRIVSSNTLKNSNNTLNIKYYDGFERSQHRYQDANIWNYTNLMKFKIYRCQLFSNQETCCCSCNSDAMFEVMKGLYDCYKMKNCDRCNCILCGHIHVDARRLGELKKSITDFAEGTKSEKAIDDTIRKAEITMEGKTPAEKETILKDLAMSGIPLPEGKTASEKSLIKKVKTDLGLPIGETDDDNRKIRKAAKQGLLQPLEGKSPKEKEKILKNFAVLGIPLPEGRTTSEKELIQKVKAAVGVPLEEPAEKLKTRGLLTPLEGKTPEEKEKILKRLAMAGLPLPKAKTASEQKLINKVRSNLGLPQEPKSTKLKEKYKQAADMGLLQPLEGKTPEEKEKILQKYADMGIPLPKGRTPSEKALIGKIQTVEPPIPTLSQKLRKAKAAGLTTPLQGKTPEQRENILKGLAELGIPLPEGKTDSEKNIINKVRADIGLPPEPKTASMKDKHNKAAKAGLLQPLEGKTPKEKERILRGLADMGIPLPEGRTASEKALIAKVKKEARPPSKEPPGLITPLEGKTPEQKEKILKGIAMNGMPLPEPKTASEQKLLDKVRTDLGLPPEPKTRPMKDKYEKAAELGLMQPLEGKTPKEKEKILRGLADLGIPLPEGRTPSEKALIAKVQEETRAPSLLPPSEKMRRAKAAGLLTPLEGKTPEQKEKILRGLAKSGIPLPEGKTPSEKNLIDKVRKELGLPPEPTTSEMRDKYAKAADAGFLRPLEGKSPKEKQRILEGQADMGIPLPEGRTPSEKSLIAKIQEAARESPVLSPKEKMRKAKAAGLFTPLKGKTPEQKDKILTGLAMHDIALPEGKTDSEKKIIDKVRAVLGLPPEPETPEMRDKYAKAADDGFLRPLEGKSPKEKERILRGLADMGIPLPVGRTPSEKSLIARVQKEARPLSIIAPSAKMRKAKAAGLITPLKGKTPEQQEKVLKGLVDLGIPLPKGRTNSEKKIIDKVRKNLGLPPEPTTPEMKDKHAKAADAGILLPLEGKTPEEKEKILRGLADMGIPLPEGRTPSEKALIAKVQKPPSEKIKGAKAEGLLTPLEGKTPEQKEKILKELANKGIPLPEGKTPSDKKLFEKVRADLGLPPEPTTAAMRDKHDKAAKAGFLQPLEGKSPKVKEKILRGLADLGIPLPEGRTPSEKSLIAKVKKETPSERLRKAKAAGLFTPLEGKTPEEKKKILKALAEKGVPFPEGKTASEQNLINDIRAELGLPPEPKTRAMKDKHDKAAELGLLQPLEGKTPAEKERILRGLADIGIPLPEGRTPSEKSLIAKIQKETGAPSVLPSSEKMRRAKTKGLLTPLEGKTPEEKEKAFKALANSGIPLPEGTTDSEKKLLDKVRKDLGLPPAPTTPEMKEKYAKAADAGLLQPLEGKSPKEKRRILEGLADMDIPLPEGRTPSEKSLIAKVLKEGRTPSILAPSEKMRRAKAAGLITPLAGKTPEQKEKILKGLAMNDIPLPEGKTDSEKKLVDKVRAELGLPPEPTTSEMRDKHAKAADAGILRPLEGKSPKEKERILRGLADMGIPLPEGRTPSEKSLVAKVQKEGRSPSEMMRKAKAAGLLTPLEGKSPDQKKKILQGLAMHGIPLPEGKTASEKKLIKDIRADLGLPPEPKTRAMKDKHDRAADLGLLQPLEGKNPLEKERILRGLADIGVPLPEGRTPSEKALIAKVQKEARLPSLLSASEKMRRAKAAGLLTPLEGKTPEQKEKILKGLAKSGIPLPEGKTPSEKNLIDKVRKELGLPPAPTTPEMRDKHAKAADAGLLRPLEGKSPKEKKRILEGLADMGIPLPEGRTPSEKSLIAKVQKEVREPSIISPSEKLRRAKAAGLITPLAGKTPEQKEKILKGLAMNDIPLPEGKTDSEKKLVDKVRAELGLPPEPKTPEMRDKYAKAADAGILRPLEGKSPKEKERILKGLADMGIPFPEGRTESEKSLIAKVQKEARPPSKVSRPPSKVSRPPSKEERPPSKVSRPPSKVSRPPSKEARPPSIRAPSEKMRKAKLAGLITPLKGKTPETQEKILKGLADLGIPLPEGKTDSEKKIIDKVRIDLALPPEPTTAAMRDKHDKAAEAGFLLPLEGKTPKEKENILRGLADLGIPLPEGRTPSEKSLIAKVKKETPSDRLRKAKTAGLISPLEGKTPEEKEKILKAMAKSGIPLPEGKTASEKSLVDKVRKNLGLPPAPKTPEMRDKHAKAAEAGFLQPLEGKTPKEKERILRGLADMGIPLPEGRTASEKSLISKVQKEARPPSKVSRPPSKVSRPPSKEERPPSKVSRPPSKVSRPPSKEARPPPIRAPSEKMRKAKLAGLITPLKGKTPETQEKILKGLADLGIPLPEGKTDSEKKIIDKVRIDLALPPEPTTAAMRDKHDKAAEAGFLLPLEGKTPKEKENILRGLADLGIPLPEGRTPSEKSLIAKVKKETPSDRLRKAKTAGLISPLEGKTPEEKEKILKAMAKSGIPLPEGKTASEKSLVDKVRKNLGLPPAPKTPEMRDKHAKAAEAGLLRPLEGMSPKDKKRILEGLADMGIPLPEGRTPSEKSLIAKVQKEVREPSILAPSEKMRRAKAAGLITPLAGKTPEQKEKILKGLAMNDIPLPEGKTDSEKKLIDKVRAELGLPPEPMTPEMRDKYAKAADAGLLRPLEGKSPKEKDRILRGLADMGIPLPEGRTASEKSLIAKIQKESRPPSEKTRKAKPSGVLSPLEGKSPEEKKEILKAIAMRGMPLPEGKTDSEKKLIHDLRADLGLPPEPKTRAMKDKHEKAAELGVLQPLEGKAPNEKERILRGLADIGIPLPEGRTPSEKALIAKVEEETRAPSLLPPSEKMRRAIAAGLLTPLEGKTPEQKEKILKGLAKSGIPLPEGKTPSEKNLIDKVRKELGLPPAPTTPEMRDKHAKAADAGFLRPLEGKSPKEKKRILEGLVDMGIPLPEGRTPSEKSLIAKVQKEVREPSILAPSEKMRRAKAAGLITPLSGKIPEQKERILKGLAINDIPLPEGKTDSEKKLVDKVRAELGLPPEPKTPEMRDKHAKAADAGILRPLEGKSPKEKERILRGLADMGIPLPEGRTDSEKSLIAKVQKVSRPPSKVSRPPSKEARPPSKVSRPPSKEARPSSKVSRPPSKEARPPSKVSRPPSKEERPPSKVSRPPSKVSRPPSKEALSEKMRKAKLAGLITPLKGKTPEQREKILKGLADLGLPLPEGETDSEKKLINKLRADLGLPPEPTTPETKKKVEAKARPPSITTEKMRKAKEAGLFTPLTGKSPEEKEKLLKALAEMGLPLPEGRTPSERALIAKVKEDLGIVDESPEEKIRKAKAAGYLTPLKGKTADQKEKILRGRAAAGLPLPEGTTPSERALIDKIKASTGYVTPSPSERLKTAEAAGLVIPLKGKTRSERKKILNDMLAAGVPIPEGETPSEKELIKKITAGVPLTTKSEKLRGAKAAGLLTPLTGKTPEQKEKIVRGLAEAGLPLPEAKTPSEKKLIDKVRAEIGLPPEPKTPSIKDKYNKAQADGLITPLEGKLPAEKEAILRKLQAAGIPLPEGRTPSEKSMIKKITARTPSQRLKTAKAAGLLTPLEDKAPVEKERILRELAKIGVPLPEAKTPSEKELINKIRKDMGLPPEPETASLKKKMHEAQAAGLLTPLDGKTPSEKENILRGLANMGIPLPEGRTPSEKSLINKIKQEAAEKLSKTKAPGLITPLEGKTPAEKEKIIRGLAEAGLPLPEGKTASEKSLIKRIRAETGPPAEKIPSEKKVSKKLTKSVGSIPQEIEEITKTTVCDHACGCDKKKIKFKHSYVKIRVTSPDISSLCPCPNECIPGVKNGVFMDNEGIKVTIGSVVGIPSYFRDYMNVIFCSKNEIRDGEKKTYSGRNNSVPNIRVLFDSLLHRNVLKKTYNFYNFRACHRSDNSSFLQSRNNTYTEEDFTLRYNQHLQSSCSSGNCSYLSKTSISNNFSWKAKSSTILIVRSDASLCLSSSTETIESVSCTADNDSSIISITEDLDHIANGTDYWTEDPTQRDSNLHVHKIASITCTKSELNIHRNYNLGDFYDQTTEIKLSSPMYAMKQRTKSGASIIIINNISSEKHIKDVVDELISKNVLKDASSLFVVVPASFNEDNKYFSD